jgi:hypothetical protein
MGNWPLTSSARDTDAVDEEVDDEDDDAAAVKSVVSA